MFVCICNQVTDKQIRQAAEEGLCSFDSLSAELNVGTCCGKCRTCARKVLREALKENAYPKSYPDGFVPAYTAV